MSKLPDNAFVLLTVYIVSNSYVCVGHVGQGWVARAVPVSIQRRVRRVHWRGHMQRQKRRLWRGVVAVISTCAPCRVMSPAAECLFIGGGGKGWREASTAGVIGGCWAGRCWSCWRRRALVILASFALQLICFCAKGWMLSCNRGEAALAFK